MSQAHANGANYSVSGKQTVVKVPGLQAVRFTMAPGEATPWHHHSQVTDRFFCLAGPMQVELRDPGEIVTLACGDECAVDPGRMHRAVNPGQGVVRYLLLQGVGEYDFIAAGGEAG